MEQKSLIDDLPKEQLFELEDKSLTNHIDNVRKMLQQNNTIINDNPGEVIENDKKIRILLSEIIINLNNKQNNLNILADNLYINHLQCEELSSGIKPYIFQEYNTSTEIFKKYSNFFNEYNLKINELIFLANTIEKDVTIVRRLYETIIQNVYDYV